MYEFNLALCGSLSLKPRFFGRPETLELDQNTSRLVLWEIRARSIHSLQPLVRSDRWKEGVAIHPSDPVRGCYSDPTSEETYYRADY